ncbi:uncharacterized protein LOC114936225 [Nylanderia fulva]|uniref:uncharacterized protein LOC114936225 n=1 Tax=Nylanderia fulva TaxID=613905 RepID=UPI0010FAE5CA|nr:uncharacterized protein LOC114936225 [Nylanderia fulva]
MNRFETVSQEENMDWSKMVKNKRKSSDNEEIKNYKKSGKEVSEVHHKVTNSAEPIKVKKTTSQIIKNFQEDNKGPFTVWIQSKAIESNEKTYYPQVSQYKVGKLFCKKFNSIDYVCNKTRSRVEINFKNIHEANQLLDDPLLEANKLKAFIPSFRLIRRGIIKGVDEDISEEEMLEEMESHQRILGIRRLNRRNRDPNRQENDPKWVPSKSVIITFSGQNLPSEVRLYKIKIEVDPYMTLPIVCYNCFKLGHTSLNCRNETKCSMCGENKHQESCGTSCPKCSNCKGEHIATDRNCPIYRMEYEVKRLMAYENLAMGDARKLVFHPPPKKRLKPGPEEFPNLLSTAYTTYSEVVKDRRSLPTVPRKPQEKPNNFYKAQMENCENFIGSRESINSANGVAMGQGSSGKKTIQTNKDQSNKTNKSAKTEDHLQLIQNVRGQRVILKDLSNKPEYTMMKKEVQVKVTPPNNFLKTIRTYQKSAKVTELNNNSK